MPPFPGDNLRKILPSEWSIIYGLKSETYKAIALLLLLGFLSCIPYWILAGIYLYNPHWYNHNDLAYVWIYVRCFWNSFFLITIYHPIYHIRPSNLICISLIVFLIFDGFDTLFAYYYLHVDIDSNIDADITHLIIYMKDQTICNLFNCTYINTYHFVLFVITFPLMNLFGLLITVIYLKCFTVYGTTSNDKKKYYSFQRRPSSFIEISTLSQESNPTRSNLYKHLLSCTTTAALKDPNKLSLDEKNFVLTTPDNSSINSTTKKNKKLSFDLNVSIKSINSIEQNELESDRRSVVTLNAEPCTTSLLSLRDQSQLLFGNEAQKQIKQRKSLKNPSIDSSHLHIWYGSQVIRTKKSLDDSIMNMINMESSDLPIIKENLFKVIILNALLCIMFLMLFFSVYCWYFIQNKYVNTQWTGLIYYIILLFGYGLFNGIFNHITLRIDRYRQYYYDISIQILIQLFIDALYWLLYRYNLLLIMPLMTNGEKQWFHESGFIVIMLHNIFQILLPGFFFASETFYEFVENESIIWPIRKILCFFNFYDKHLTQIGYNQWRERYSLLMIITIICCGYSFMTCSGFIIEIYSIGDKTSIDNIHDVHEGTIYVLLSFIIEIIFLLVMNYRIFEGAMMEPMLRLYELNPVRLLLSFAVVLACTMNMFGQTLFQETLAGVH
eukprot:428213_1